MAYDPQSPEVVRFIENIPLNPCAAGMMFNYPWPEAPDSPRVLALKARWRVLRGLPPEPFADDL
jgi:hypothetical protein